MAVSSKWFNFDLTDDQLDILDWVREFVQKEIRPAAAEWDNKEETPWPLIKKAADCDLYSLDFYMQLFADPSGRTLSLALEEIFWGDAGIGLALFGTGLAVSAIIANGTPEQAGQWLPQCFGTKEKPAVAAFCASESGAGSDVSAIRATARYNKAKDTWTLNGTKDWITNGGIAGVHVVVASVDNKLGSRGQASFVIPPNTPGLSQGTKHKKLGIRASHTAEVVLDNVVVPGNCLLGGKDKLDKRLAKARSGESSLGEQAAMKTFEASRPLVGAMAVGIARAALDYAREYALTRLAFGSPIADKQAIAFKLADMDTEIDAARLLVHRAAGMALSGQDMARAEGSKAKLFASEVAVRATREAVQILAGAGYVKDHPVERWLRDALIYTIFEGTSEIQRIVIARALTGRNVR